MKLIGKRGGQQGERDGGKTNNIKEFLKSHKEMFYVYLKKFTYLH